MDVDLALDRVEQALKPLVLVDASDHNPTTTQQIALFPSLNPGLDHFKGVPPVRALAGLASTHLASMR